MQNCRSQRSHESVISVLTVQSLPVETARDPSCFWTLFRRFTSQFWLCRSPGDVLSDLLNQVLVLCFSFLSGYPRVRFDFQPKPDWILFVEITRKVVTGTGRWCCPKCIWGLELVLRQVSREVFQGVCRCVAGSIMEVLVVLSGHVLAQATLFDLIGEIHKITD